MHPEVRFTKSGQDEVSAGVKSEFNTFHSTCRLPIRKQHILKKVPIQTPKNAQGLIYEGKGRSAGRTHSDYLKMNQLSQI